jgi:uncharacterized repeat protein (TIGR03803 family)
MKPRELKSNLVRFWLIVALGFCLPESALASPIYKVLHDFNGTDGAGLWAPVTLDKHGYVYGATSGGGKYNHGIVFRLTPGSNGDWTEAILHNFPSSAHDGQGPNGGLIQDSAGHWYGTTNGGGFYDSGTVFELTHRSQGWEELPLYKFGTQHSDEGQPSAGPVMDGSGSLYGTTRTTVFELLPRTGGWKENILHRFGIRKGDGGAPYAGLILDAAGNLYGTTRGGGAYNGGTVYEVQYTSGGWKEKVLHSFHLSQTDGNTPGWGSLFMDSSGSLYGTTAGGGCCGGVVFKLTPESNGRWKETILDNFHRGVTGYSPNAGVVMDKAGNLYGTTDYGGDPYCGCGVIYKLSPGPKGKWSYTVLHEFGIGNDGGVPEGNLVMDSKGNLYGGTALGGTYGGGVVFELTP